MSSFVPFSVVKEAQAALSKVDSLQLKDKEEDNKYHKKTLDTSLYSKMSEIEKMMKDMKNTLDKLSNVVEKLNKKEMDL